MRWSYEFFEFEIYEDELDDMDLQSIYSDDCDCKESECHYCQKRYV